MDRLLLRIAIIFVSIFYLDFWRLDRVFLQLLPFLPQWRQSFNTNQSELFFWVPASKVTVCKLVGLWTFISVKRKMKTLKRNPTEY